MPELDMDQAIGQLNDLQERVRLGQDIDPEEYQVVVDNLRKTRKAGEARKTTQKVEDKAASKVRGADIPSQLEEGKQ